jgi:hypothetical protein
MKIDGVFDLISIPYINKTEELMRKFHFKLFILEYVIFLCNEVLFIDGLFFYKNE